MKRLDDLTFRMIKKELHWYTPPVAVAVKNHVGLKTVLQVKGSKDFEEYQAQTRAQHPPVKYSLADDVLDLHRITFDRHDNKYLPPLTARKAMAQLLDHVRVLKLGLIQRIKFSPSTFVQGTVNAADAIVR